MSPKKRVETDPNVQKSTENAQNAADKIRSLKPPAKIEPVLHKAPKQLAHTGIATSGGADGKYL
jgi:hypothetical protein